MSGVLGVKLVRYGCLLLGDKREGELLWSVKTVTWHPFENGCQVKDLGCEGE